MNRNALLLFVAASMLCTACPRRGGTGDDDDTAGNFDFRGLDTDDDGELTSGDVSTGAALPFTVPGAEGDEEILVDASSANIYPSETGNWSLNGGFTAGDVYWWYGISFENSGSMLEPGVGNIVSFEMGEKTSFGRMFRSNSPGGSVEVESVEDFRAFGHVSGEPEADGLDPETGEPDGTTVTLHGLAFADVSTGVDG